MFWIKRTLHFLFSFNFILSVFLLLMLWLGFTLYTDDQHPIQEFLFGYEEEGFVFYPVTHRNYFFGITLMVLVLFIMVLVVLRVNWRNAKILSQKNQIITDTNHKITASIQYAKRIQSGLLPSESLIETCFTQSFVLYQPRDIVSGDLYWIAKIGNLKVIAAIDCTGHGVPGAFLTIMAHRGLNKIVKEKGILHPPDILFQLHKEIYSSFRQNGESAGNDGMELGICMINSELGTLFFSCANLPLYHVSKNQIQKFKGNRLSVGSEGIDLAGPNPFNCTQIEYEPEDTFYMFSDGFADQFGGPSNRKFLSANLQKFVLEISPLPLISQKEKLAKELADWKGNLMQTDDILGIGFQV